MRITFEQILELTTLLKNIPIKYRIKDTKHYKGASGWNSWLNNPTRTYLDFGYEPLSYREIREIHINPIEEKYIGKLIPTRLIDHTDKICKVLEKLNIKYKYRDIIILIE